MRAVPPDCVLFDLDGTLLDTAPDLAATLNRLRRAHGESELVRTASLNCRLRPSGQRFPKDRRGC